MQSLRSHRPTAVLTLVLLAGAAIAAPSVTSWTAPALTKVFPDASPGASHAIRLRACRNEVEWGQVVFRSPERVTVRLRVSDLVGASGHVIPAASISLHPAVYVHVTHLSGNGQRERYWPEVLPVGDTFTLEPDRNQPVYVGVRVPEGAAPGMYEGVVTWEGRGAASGGAGHPATPLAIAPSPHLTVPLRLRVWPLTLPRTPTTRTSYYVWWEGIEERFGLADKPALKQRVFDRFFAFMLDHRLCPMSLPVDIRQADRYMRDPRVNGVRLPYGDDEAALRETIAFVKRKGWLSRCFYYLLDEPTRRDWGEVRRVGFQIAGLDPLMPRLDTIQPDPELEGAVSIWCPNVESVYLYDDRIAALTGVGAAPSEVWWYTCVFPKYPYPTFLLDDDAIAPRLLFWAQPRHGLTGSLYINTIHWGPEGNDPWAEAAVAPELANNNDGLIMYTGRGTTLAEAHPVTGVRLEMIRDGLEDVELCHMLGREISRLAGPAVARQHLAALASQVLPDLRHADRDPRHLLWLREQVADEIMTLQANPSALAEMLKLPLRVGPDRVGRDILDRPADDKFAVALRGTPVIDGKLDDACWQASMAANAPGTRTVITRFRNLTGRAWPGQETVVNCVHDDANLFFAWRCGEPEVAGLVPLSEQADLGKVDRVAVALDIGGQERWFVVTVEGTRFEGSLQRPQRVRGGQWEAKTHFEAEGYSVEMRLPCQLEAGAPTATATAGQLEAGAPRNGTALFNLFRFAAPGQETLYFTGRHSSKQNPLQFGTLELR